MPHSDISKDMAEVVDIVATASGSLVGKTRLQKTACLLSMTGLSDNFAFIYKHFGPFSQDLANVTELAFLFDDLKEEQKRAHWGGTYSVFSTSVPSRTPIESPRARIIKIANSADPIELELATTAAFLAKQGFSAPWEETADRKPDKIGSGRLERAKVLYAKLRQVATPALLPDI